MKRKIILVLYLFIITGSLFCQKRTVEQQIQEERLKEGAKINKRFSAVPYDTILSKSDSSLIVTGDKNDLSFLSLSVDKHQGRNMNYFIIALSTEQDILLSSVSVNSPSGSLFSTFSDVKPSKELSILVYDSQPPVFLVITMLRKKEPFTKMWRIEKPRGFHRGFFYFNFTVFSIPSLIPIQATAFPIPAPHLRMRRIFFSLLTLT